MKNYEMYIEDSLLELDDSFDFSLMYNTSIFKELTDIQANRTTTIKIPKTVNNLKAVEFSNIPENTTLFPYQVKTVNLFKNGMPLIQNGKGYILSITDHIEISITWGIVINVKQLQDLKLRDMPCNDFIIWDYVSWNDDIGGFTAAKWSNQIYQVPEHPFIKVDWIIKKMKSVIGYNFVFPNKINALYEKLFIPLLDTNSGRSDIDDIRFNFINDMRINPILDPNGLIDSFNRIAISEDCTITFAYGGEYDSFRLPIIDVNYLSGTIQWVRFRIFKNGIEMFVERSTPVRVDIINHTGCIPLYLQNATFDCLSGDKIWFSLEIRTSHGDYLNLPLAYNDFPNSYITMSTKAKELQYMDNYPIVANLPDISYMDIIHTITSMFGLFGSMTNSGISFFSIDDIYNNKANSVDWTKKLITGSTYDELDFSLDNFAQQNWLRYAEDDTVNTNADWYIQVNSDILDNSADLYQMKFAPSDSFLKSYGTLNDGTEATLSVAYIPVYYYTPGDSTYTVQKLTPRIVCIDNYLIESVGLTTKAARFIDDMSFVELINDYYSDYQDLVLHPKMIQAQFILTDIDIYQIDMMKPVYLEQTGNYYIISELTIDKNNVAKAKLIQM